MVILQRIRSGKEVAFQKLLELYTEAFPPEERRDTEQLAEWLDTKPAMCFNAVECDGVLAGLVGISGLFIIWSIWLYLLI